MLRIPYSTYARLFKHMCVLLILTLDTVGAVESVKAASDVITPVSGTIVEVNENLSSDPALVNKSAEGDGKCEHGLSQT